MVLTGDDIHSLLSSNSDSAGSRAGLFNVDVDDMVAGVGEVDGATVSEWTVNEFGVIQTLGGEVSSHGGVGRTVDDEAVADMQA